ncbi:MAG: thiamine ABC transporter substrate binding subunit [Devosia sp.]|uniref:thiamine ABC transporter substrate binding subunit n=1 Tax=Devosia sp. TaxID=1871048 RepID=UPI001AD2EDAE|nr:thiamine ABC transporter substrate binding subunit [Devosia sp.]MBN9317808.1 thiamine ABC transporter substrate binding subunit [Devosia sp.]
MYSFNRFALAAVICALAFPTLAQDKEAKPVLDIYTYDSFAAEWGPGPQLKAGFEKTCGCTVNFTTAEDAISTLRKVQLEGAATKADVVVGLDTATSGEARATGLFAPHGQQLNGLVLPWTDVEFVPFDYGYFAYVYNKEKTPNPPTSFEELIALPASFKIVIEDPRSSTPGLGNVFWIAAAYGDRAPEIWKGLKPHVLTMTRGWSEAYGLFLDGQADMVLSYTTSPAYHAIAEHDDKYAYARFTEGFIPQVEVAGLLKSSDQAELGQKFLAYLVSPEAQKVIPTTNWMYPVIDIGADLPAAFGTPPGKVLALDEASIAANSRAWVDAALAALQ